jgi:hypothetical protein
MLRREHESMNWDLASDVWIACLLLIGAAWPIMTGTTHAHLGSLKGNVYGKPQVAGPLPGVICIDRDVVSVACSFEDRR